MRYLATGLVCGTLLALALMPVSDAYAQATDVDCAKCVDKDDIAGRAVTTGKLANDAVTGQKLDDRSVNSHKIKGGSVTQGKFRDGAVTNAKIRDGAVTPDKVAPELSNAIDSSCEPGDVVVGKDSDGNWTCQTLNAPATCNELLYTGTMWDTAVTGFDLRERTDSSLHFIGVYDFAGTFYCEETPGEDGTLATGTLEFGSTGPEGSNVLRALVDSYSSSFGSSDADSMTGGPRACCSEENRQSVCNAPNDLKSVSALCNALGYTWGDQGEGTTNICPEVTADSDGTWGWATDYVQSEGSGNDYYCSNEPN